MSQFYQVTSLEELRRIYPNIQFDNLEGVSPVIQDDQGTQYIDGQGQQVITAVESSGMQFSAPASSQSCHIQQPQFIVHQPTQFVIHQMDTNESQQLPIQYIQQRPQPSGPMNKEENFETHFQDQSVGCTETDIGEEQSMSQSVIKTDEKNISQQYISQIQPVLHQPMHIHRQISTIRNIQDQSVVSNVIKKRESIENTQENSKQQNSQIAIQKLQENQEQIPKQDVHNTHVPHSVTQEQLMHQPHQQILQSVQYYNQLTVIDGFPSSKKIVEKSATLNENILQQQHVVRTQEFEMSKQSALANRMPLTKKLSEQEVDGSVFVVEEVESPLLVRDTQSKFCSQPSTSSAIKSTETVSTQSVPTQHEQNLVQQTSLSSRLEFPPKINISVQSSQENFSNDVSYSEIRAGNTEHSLANKIEQMTKMKIVAPGLTKPLLTKNKSMEQQTESITLSDSKSSDSPQFSRFSSAVHPRLRVSFPQIQSSSAGNLQNPTFGSGRGARGFTPRGGNVYCPRPGNTQIQTSPPRIVPNIKVINSGREGKSPQDVRGTKGECVIKGPDERQGSFVRTTSPQVIQSPNSKDETSQSTNEPVEEARMVVLLGNGEKKIVKIPCSQNILIGQLLQQTKNVCFRCQLCSYRARDSSQLTVHLRTHTGDSPFICTNIKCKAAFKTNSDLKRHMVVHSAEKPHSCSYCPYKSTLKRNLQTHLQSQHPNGEMKEFKCHLCPRHVSSTSRKLKNHLKKDHGISEKKPSSKKTTAEKAFSEKEQNLVEKQGHFKKRKRKLRKSSDKIAVGVMNKAYDCKLCDASFVCQDSLVTHQRYHSKIEDELRKSETGQKNLDVLGNGKCRKSQDDVDKKIEIYEGDSGLGEGCVVDSSFSDSLRNAEILASLNSTQGMGSIRQYVMIAPEALPSIYNSDEFVLVQN